MKLGPTKPDQTLKLDIFVVVVVVEEKIYKIARLDLRDWSGVPET